MCESSCMLLFTFPFSLYISFKFMHLHHLGWTGKKGSNFGKARQDPERITSRGGHFYNNNNNKKNNCYYYLGLCYYL